MLTLYRAFASLATLIITFKCPALTFIEETRQEYHIRNGYEIMRPWEHLPMIRRGLERVRIMMRQVGLADVDDENIGLPTHIVNQGPVIGVPS